MKDLEKFVMMRRLTHVAHFDKRFDKILLSSSEELPVLLSRIKKHGEGIVEPRYLLEDIKAAEIEGSTSLSLIREAVGLHFGVALALYLDDENWGYVQVDYSLETVETLEESDYSLIRRESMKGGAGGYSQQVGEPIGVVLQQPGKGFSGMRHSEGKNRPVIKRIKH